MKSVLVALLLLFVISGFSLMENLSVNAQTGTPISGIINQNTIWTKANSPYSLTGPTAVNKGATLTIEAGVTVNLNSHYIQVNGTLIAKGSNAEKISFSNGQIIFTQSAVGWDEQNGSGSIIENALFSSEISVDGFARLTSKIIIANSPKITHSNINAYIEVNSGSPIISDNTLNNKYRSDYLSANEYMVLTLSGGAPKIINNTITGIAIKAGSPAVLNNNITRGTDTSSYAAINILGGSPTISNNIIASGTHTWGGGSFYPGGKTTFNGINGGNNAHISDNIISGCAIGIATNLATIERNVIENSSVGIEINSGVIQNNTITNNSIAIRLKQPGSVTITYNNIENSLQNAIYLQDAPNNVNATYNWWGTTDTQTIAQSIHDFKNDFNLGNVIFTPLLMSPNALAPAATPVSIPIAIPSSTPAPTQTPAFTPPITPTPMPESTSPPSYESTQTIGPSVTPTLKPTQSLGLSPIEAPTTIPSPSTVSSQPVMQAFQVDQYLVVIGVLAGALAVMGAAIAVLVRKNRKLAGSKQ